MSTIVVWGTSTCCVTIQAWPARDPLQSSRSQSVYENSWTRPLVVTRHTIDPPRPDPQRNGCDAKKASNNEVCAPTWRWQHSDDLCQTWQCLIYFTIHECLALLATSMSFPLRAARFASRGMSKSSMLRLYFWHFANLFRKVFIFPPLDIIGLGVFATERPRSRCDLRVVLRSCISRASSALRVCGWNKGSRSLS